MYQMVKIVQNDFHSPEVHRKKLALYLQKEFFGGEDRGRSAAYEAFKKKKVPASKYAAYLQCAELNADSIKETLANNQFNNAYSKAAYILGILNRYSAEAVAATSDADFDPREMY